MVRLKPSPSASADNSAVVVRRRGCAGALNLMMALLADPAQDLIIKEAVAGAIARLVCSMDLTVPRSVCFHMLPV